MRQEQQSYTDTHLPPGGEGAIDVADEAALRAALAAAELGWLDRRVVRLTASIALRETLVLSEPAIIQGHCPDEADGRCVLSTAAADGSDFSTAAADGHPLLHATGPAAVVQLEGLRLSGGTGSADGKLAGGLTASNHSAVDLVRVLVSGCSGQWGGGLRADTHARISLVRSEVRGCSAVQAGGGMYMHAATVHLAYSQARWWRGRWEPIFMPAFAGACESNLDCNSLPQLPQARFQA